MHTDSRLLTLTQWLSPAYPVGGFGWSHGLEAAIAEVWVSDVISLEAWLRDVLAEGSGRSDALFVVLAHGAEDITVLDATARAYAASLERQQESARQGAAFAAVTREVWALDLPDVMLPVALGRAAGLVGMEPEPVAALYLHSFVSNLTSAAQRLMPLGQTAAQGIVHRLAPLCIKIAADVHGGSLDDLSSQTFLSDIAAMRHETQQPRLFQS